MWLWCVCVMGVVVGDVVWSVGVVIALVGLLLVVVVVVVGV